MKLRKCFILFVSLSAIFFLHGNDTQAGEFSSSSFGCLKDIYELYKPPYDLRIKRTGGVLLITAGLIKYDRQLFDFFRNDLQNNYFRTELGPALNDWALPAFTVYGLFAPQTRRERLINIEAIVYTAVNVQVLKFLIGGSRPVLGEEHFIGPTLRENYDAMPSDHTAHSFALATVLSKEYPKYKWCFFSAATAIGLLRITNGNHWPSNVFAGAVLGIWCGERVWRQENSLELNYRF